MSQDLYIDIFPPFTYQGNGPKKLWTGTCEGPSGTRSSIASYSGKTVDECNDLCVKTPGCTTFVLKIHISLVGECLLHSAGCSYTISSVGSTTTSYNFYEKFDAIELSDCKMASHILVSNNGGKIVCENEELCDKIKLNISETGLLSYYVLAVGGPDSIYDPSGLR